MRLFGKFELPNVFAALSAWSVPRVNPGDSRTVASVLSQPRFTVYNPEALNFPDMQGPVVPGNQNVTMGLGPVAYDNQPLWDRRDTRDAGPVREFFRRQQSDNSVKHS